MAVSPGPEKSKDIPVETRGVRAERIFQEAMKLEPDARAAFLEEACSDDLWLRGAINPLLKSKPLAEKIAAGTLTVQDIVYLGINIATEVGSRHAEGKTHGDIKPETILVSQGYRVRILNFKTEGPVDGTRRDIIGIGVVLHDMIASIAGTEVPDTLIEVAATAAHPDRDVRYPTTEGIKDGLWRVANELVRIPSEPISPLFILLLVLMLAMLVYEVVHFLL